MKKSKKSFSEKILRIRKQAIMSQRDFAKALGVSLHSTCHWEDGTYVASCRARSKIKEFCDERGIQFNNED